MSSLSFGRISDLHRTGLKPREAPRPINIFLITYRNRIDVDSESFTPVLAALHDQKKMMLRRVGELFGEKNGKLLDDGFDIRTPTCWCKGQTEFGKTLVSKYKSIHFID